MLLLLKHSMRHKAVAPGGECFKVVMDEDVKIERQLKGNVSKILR